MYRHYTQSTVRHQVHKTNRDSEEGNSDNIRDNIERTTSVRNRITTKQHQIHSLTLGFQMVVQPRGTIATGVGRNNSTSERPGGQNQQHRKAWWPKLIVTKGLVTMHDIEGGWNIETLRRMKNHICRQYFIFFSITNNYSFSKNYYSNLYRGRTSPTLTCLISVTS